MDLKMSAYGCTSSGDMQGMIEIVPNAETIGHIFEKSMDIGAEDKKPGKYVQRSTKQKHQNLHLYTFN